MEQITPLSLLRVTPIFALILMCIPMDGYSQGDTNYLTGKAYVIRITPFVQEKDSAELILGAAIQTQLNSAGGMITHVRNNLYTMRAATDGRWFIGYFHADRQGREDLMRDFDLLLWLFHGHDVQIMPIESTASPAVYLASPTNRR